MRKPSRAVGKRICTIVTEALVPTPAFFPLIDKLAAKANTQLAIITEVLAGAWERLEQGRADIVIAPDMHFRSLVGDQLAQALYVNERLCCRAGSPDSSGAGTVI